MSGLSAPRILFGVHSITPYSRTDKTPYGILKVVGSANIALSSKIDQLYGGSNKFSWAAESSTIATDVTAKVKAYPGFLFTLWLGGTNTDNVAEATGSVTTLTNFKGTSCKSAVTGIASVAIHSGTETTVPFGNYVVKVVSATTVDVYLMSDEDLARGTAAYSTDTLKIATALVITTSGALTAITGVGIDLVGGSGTIGMTTGDTAVFKSRPENSGSSDVTIGSSSTSFSAFGAIFLAQKRVNAEMFEIEAFNVVAAGLPINLAEMAFSETELKMTLLYDSVQNAVMVIRAVQSLT